MWDATIHVIFIVVNPQHRVTILKQDRDSPPYSVTAAAC